MPPNLPTLKHRRFIIECIQLYRDLPSLWNVKSKQYHDRHKKNKEYEILLSKYREVYPEATKDDLKKKFNALRTNYRKELKKYVLAMQSGGSPYHPSLWYFNEMNFLHEEDFQVDSESSMLDISQYSNAKEDISFNEVHILDEDRSGSQASTSDDDEDTALVEIPRKRARKEKQHIKLQYEHINDKNDEFYHWAMACASDLRNMERTQQLYAKKAIAEIIMEGQLGLLHRNSVKIN